jgi:hypothetical protein
MPQITESREQYRRNRKECVEMMSSDRIPKSILEKKSLS